VPSNWHAARIGRNYCTLRALSDRKCPLRGVLARSFKHDHCLAASIQPPCAIKVVGDDVASSLTGGTSGAFGPAHPMSVSMAVHVEPSQLGLDRDTEPCRLGRCPSPPVVSRQGCGRVCLSAILWGLGRRFGGRSGLRCGWDLGFRAYRDLVQA
jgi:hypothetical protein